MAGIKRTAGVYQRRCRIVEHGGLVWTVATAPGDTVAEQTRNSLAVIETNLAEAGTDKHHIPEATVYLTDLATKPEMDAVWMCLDSGRRLALQGLRRRGSLRRHDRRNQGDGRQACLSTGAL